LDLDEVEFTVGENARLTAEGTSAWQSTLSDDILRFCFLRGGFDDILPEVKVDERLTIRVQSAGLASVSPKPDYIRRSRAFAEMSWLSDLPDTVEVRLDRPQSLELRRLPLVGPGLLFTLGPVAALAALGWIGFVTVLVPASLAFLSTKVGSGGARSVINRLIATSFAIALLPVFLSAWFQFDELLSNDEQPIGLRIAGLLSVGAVLAILAVATARRATRSWQPPAVGTLTAAAVSAVVVATTRASDESLLPEAALRLGAWLAVAVLVYIVLETISDAIAWLATRRAASGWVTLPVIGASLLLAAPSSESEPQQMLNAIGLMTVAVPALAALTAIAIGYARVNRSRFEQVAGEMATGSVVDLATLVGAFFALIVVGSGGAFGLPLALLVAFALVPVLIHPPQRIELLVARVRAVRAGRKVSIPLSSRQSETPSGEAETSPSPRTPWPSPFAIGPYARPWHNGLFGMSVGVALAGVPLAVSLALSLPEISRAAEPLLLLQVSLSVGANLLYWVGVAFTFGLGFELIRGHTGIRKGLRLGLLGALAVAPFSVLDVIVGRTDGFRALTDPFLLIAFAAVLGFAFDLRTTRRFGPQVRGIRPTIERVADTSGLRDVTAVILAVLIAIGLQLQGAFVGEVGKFVQTGLSGLT
jgi:hypothetical protein